jgi:hypothetical protein
LNASDVAGLLAAGGEPKVEDAASLRADMGELAGDLPLAVADDGAERVLEGDDDDAGDAAVVLPAAATVPTVALGVAAGGT